MTPFPLGNIPSIPSLHISLAVNLFNIARSSSHIFCFSIYEKLFLINAQLIKSFEDLIWKVKVLKGLF